MKFMLKFDGELVVSFSPEEIDYQIEFLSSIEAQNEADSEIVQRILLMVIENDTAKKKMS